MEKKQKILTESYKIASYLVNMKNRAGLYSVLNLIQDVGWIHGIHLQVRLPENQNWVFTRQKLIMNEWPVWDESLTIKTWIRPPLGPFLLRDYELFIGDRKIGEATSTFGVMDLQTRKMITTDWKSYASIWQTTDHLVHMPQKIILTEKLSDLAQFQVRNSDLDMNQHVNNTKYSQWILDAVPLDIIKADLIIHEYEVNFLAETKSGDVVTVQGTKINPLLAATTLTQFQGIRFSDGKPVFTAQIKSSQAHPAT